MNVEAHLAAGWILAHIGREESRRFRGLVTLAAIAPDVDTISYLFGIDAYATYHHAVGHNIFFGLIVSGISSVLMPARRWKVFLFTQLSFATHYYGDYFFTRFPVKAFWPISDHGYLYSYRIGLDHPVNLFLSYLSLVVIVVIGIRSKRTPLELVSPTLDCRLVNLFRHRPLKCCICSGGANERCQSCEQPVCMRHGRLTRQFAVMCQVCHAATVQE